MPVLRFIQDEMMASLLLPQGVALQATCNQPEAGQDRHRRGCEELMPKVGVPTLHLACQVPNCLLLVNSLRNKLRVELTQPQQHTQCRKSTGGLSRWTQYLTQSANALLHAGAFLQPASLKRSFSVLAALFLVTIFPGIAQALPGEFTLNQPTTACKENKPEIYLSWGASLNATQYEVYRNGMTYDPNVHSLTFNNTDYVTPGAVYNYFIRASDSTGTTDSNSVTVAAPGCTETAESKADTKLNESMCIEYGYTRLSDEFNKCMKNPLASGSRNKMSSISEPASTPATGTSASPVSSDSADAKAGVAVKAKRTAEMVCNDYGYTKGDEFETCLEYAENEGYERENKKGNKRRKKRRM